MNIWAPLCVCVCVCMLVRQRMNLNHSPLDKIKESRSNTGSHPHSTAQLPKSKACQGPGNIYCGSKSYKWAQSLPQCYKISLISPQSRRPRNPKQEHFFIFWEGGELRPKTSCCELPKSLENMTSQGEKARSLQHIWQLRMVWLLMTDRQMDE